MPKTYVQMVEPAVPPAGDAAAACTFTFLKADFVRTFPGKRLPIMQEIREAHAWALVQVTLTYADVVSGKFIEELLAVSHRWMKSDQADPDGEQLKAIKAFLQRPGSKKIKLVWIDAQSMPQDLPKGSRSVVDSASFKLMLAQINMLFLGTTVLILLDLSYVSRFWVRVATRTSCAFAR